MEEVLRQMYKDGVLDDAGLTRAVEVKGWITQEQADDIRADTTE